MVGNSAVGVYGVCASCACRTFRRKLLSLRSVFGVFAFPFSTDVRSIAAPLSGVDTPPGVVKSVGF